MRNQIQRTWTVDHPRPTETATPEPLIQVVWRQRRLVGLLAAVGLVLGVAYLLLAPRQYTAISRIYVETGTPQLVSMDNASARLSENYLNTQCELIRSTPILSLALGSLEDQPLRTLEGVENRFLYLKKHLQAQPGKKDDLIYVSFEGPDAVEASILVNSIVNAYITYQTTHRKSTAAEALVILRKEMDKRDAELTQKNDQLRDLRRQAGVMSLGGEKGNPIVQRLNTLSEALTAAHLETSNAQSRYEQALLSLKGDPSKMQQVQQSDGAVLSPADEELARAELFALQQRLVDLQRQYMSGHPSIRTIQGRVEQLRVSLVAASRQRWLAAQQKEANLQQNFEAQQTLALAQSVHTAESERLENEVRRLEQLNQVLDMRIKELGLTENSGALDINILEQAVPPPHSSSPVAPRVLALGLVGGLVLGMGAGLLRDWTDRRLRSVDEIKAALGMPVMGVVPRMPQMLTDTMKGLRVHQDPDSDVAEAYRSLRTAVYFGLSDGQAKTLLVTSPSSGDGKSTVATNLAIAMAQAGHRVLLVDADLRDPSLHKLFGVDNTLGVSNTLEDGDDIHRGIIPTSVPGLHLLPCGPRPANPSELLNSQRFSDALCDLAGEFDQVVLDSPPVTAVTDARILGAACDVTLLVISAERSDRKLSELARDGLLAVGANLMGVVVNDATPGGAFPQQYGYGRPTSGTHSEAMTTGQRLARGLGGLKVAGSDVRTL